MIETDLSPRHDAFMQQLARHDVFMQQLAYMMATDAPVTIISVGTTIVLRGKTNRATFPLDFFPGAKSYLYYRGAYRPKRPSKGAKK